MGANARDRLKRSTHGKETNAMKLPSRLRMIVALLFVVASIAFVSGVGAERSSEGDEEAHKEGAAEVSGNEAAETGPGDGESNEEAEATERAESAAGVSEPVVEGEEPGEEDEENEEIFGINPESTGAVAAAVAVSLALALAVWLTGTRAVLTAAVAFGLLFAAFDIREASGRAGESNGGLVALAIVIAVLHAGAAIAAGVALKEQSPGPSPLTQG